MFTTISYSQISPGDLSQSHADLEGISNCTKCHELGEKVSSKKCLECHDEIQSLINKKIGFHAESKVKSQECFACHSEHHGRKFEMVRFDQDNFDHSLTGYELEGKHETIDCKKCHQSENIQNRDLRKRKNTFLGLEEKCLSCHDDFHQKTLSDNCISCHDMEAFTPASKFDHDKTDYKLIGKHLDVDCKECHKVTTKNGKDFQQFADIQFNDCKACHDDPHNEQLLGKCTECHTETSFSSFKGRGKFNHNVTGFNLKGKHNKIDCFSCHSKTNNPKLVFQDKVKTRRENNCVACHKDQHEGKYGNECSKCHKESSFLSLKKMTFFDHTVTDFPLEGKHAEVDCKKCHKKRFSTPIDFTACNNCHKDYHKGEFNKKGISPDCKECHSLKNGFDYSLYTLEQHQTTTFPLEGAHNATPCFSCHVSENDKKWSFRNLGTNCIDCHLDKHKGFINEKYYPKQDCKICHVNETWSNVNFDHNRTDWPLTGKHRQVDCKECHIKKGENKIKIVQKFKGLNNECTTCHENIHGDLFAFNGVTDCKRCHITNSWFPKKFNHNNTAFPLTGQHAEVDCKECHVPKVVNGKTKIVYKIKNFECIDCHQ